MALRLHALDDFVNDLLNARSHVVDASGGKGVDHEIAQAAVIRWIKVQHPMTHGPKNWLVQKLRTTTPGHSADEVLTEALVAQYGGDVRIPASYVEPERR